MECYLCEAEERKKDNVYCKDCWEQLKNHFAEKCRNCHAYTMIPSRRVACGPVVNTVIMKDHCEICRFTEVKDECRPDTGKSAHDRFP